MRSKVKPIERWAQTWEGSLTGAVVGEPKPRNYDRYRWIRVRLVPVERKRGAKK